MKPLNKTKLKIIAGLLVVFLSGVVTGALSTGIALRHGMRQFMERSPETHCRFLMRQLSRELGLTDAQRTQAERIVENGGNEIRGLLDESHGRFAAIMQRRAAEMRAILTPEQEEKFDRMLERTQKRWPAFSTLPTSS